jgi:hypothetical protein
MVSNFFFHLLILGMNGEPAAPPGPGGAGDTVLVDLTRATEGHSPGSVKVTVHKHPHQRLIRQPHSAHNEEFGQNEEVSGPFASPFHLELFDFDVIDGNEDGIFEFGEEILLRNIRVQNSGSHPSGP